MNPTAVANGPLPRNKGTVYKVVLTGGMFVSQSVSISVLIQFVHGRGRH